MQGSLPAFYSELHFTHLPLCVRFVFSFFFLSAMCERARATLATVQSAKLEESAGCSCRKEESLHWGEKMEVREMEHLVKIIKVKSAQYLPSERPYCNQYIHHRSHGPLQWQRTKIACRIEYFPLDWKKQKDSFHLFKKVNFCFLQLA